jgi:hypothetical protein
LILIVADLALKLRGLISLLPLLSFSSKMEGRREVI